MSIYNQKNVEENEEKIDLLDYVFRFLDRWQWFVISVVSCFFFAGTYLYFSTPQFSVTSSVVINDMDRGGDAAVAGMAILEQMGISSNTTNNIDNEVIKLSSRTNIQQAVNDLALYLTYESKEDMRWHEIYPQHLSPIQLALTDRTIDKLPATIQVKVSLSNDGIVVSYKTVVYQGLKKIKESKKQVFKSFPITLETIAGTLQLTRNENLVLDLTDYRLTITPLLATAKYYMAATSVTPVSKHVSVINLTHTNRHREKGREYLDYLVKVYNQNENNNKNEVAQKTVNFLNERLLLIHKDLETVETQMENYKKGSHLTNPQLDAQALITQYSAYEQRRVENATQIALVKAMKDDFTKNKGKEELVPANIGLTDITLNALVAKYNEVLLKKQTLEQGSTESNPVRIEMEAELKATRANIAATIDNLEKSLEITRQNMDNEGHRYGRRIIDAPTQEKTLMGISREQEILSQVYQFLLQKREENAIMLAITTDQARFVDKALAEGAPVSPNTKIILLVALLAGLCVPAGLVLAKDYLQFKIVTPEDVKTITAVPLVGTLSKYETKDDNANHLFVQDGSSTVIMEELRAIRTNLQFVANGDKKIFLITSTVSGEGKSFVAANLAASLALLNKKVIIVGLDLRRPALLKIFNLHSENGISQHLASPKDYPLDTLIIKSNRRNYPDIIPAGVIPPNPAELLALPVFAETLETLKANYDYVILDTAPVGLVADTMSIAKYADVTIYVCRSEYTDKRYFVDIEEYVENNSLKQLCVLLNCFDARKSKYRSKYSYKYGGYGKYYM